MGTTSLDVITDVVQPTRQPAVFQRNDLAVAALKNGQVDGIVVDLPTAFYITGAEVTDAKVVGQFDDTGARPGAVRARPGQGRQADLLRLRRRHGAALRRHARRAGEAVAVGRGRRAGAQVTGRERRMGR